MKKIIIIAISLFIIIIGTLFLIFDINNENKKIQKEIKKIDNVEEEIDAGHLIEDTNTGMIWTTPGYGVLLLSKKNVPWGELILPTEVLDSYKAKYKNGLFGDDDYDECVLENDISEYDGFMAKEYVFYTRKGNARNKYYVRCDSPEWYCDITSIDKIQLTDENGDSVRSGLPMDEEHWIDNLKALCVRDDKEVGRTKRFDEEHPNFTGLVNPYNCDEKGIIIKIDDKLSSFENKKLHCNITTNYNSYVTEYEILFSVDENNYLDTAILNIIDQSEDANSLQAILNSKNINLMSSFIFNRLIYKNRNIMNIPISQKLKERLKNDGSIVSYYANITHYDSYYIEKQYKNNKILCKLYFDDDSCDYYGFEYIFNNNQIEDIKVTKLQLDSTVERDINELYNMF